VKFSAAKNTLAYHLDARPLTTALRFDTVMASDLGKQAHRFREATTIVSPEAEALQFYLSEHIIAALRQKRRLHEPLPEQELTLLNHSYATNNKVFLRLMFYVIIICVRESRHMKSAAGLKAKCPKELHTAFNFIQKVPDSSSEAMQVFMDKVPANLTIGDLARVMSFAFHNTGHWASGYGGSAWGAIADALVSLVEGKFSPSMFCDVSWALEHNGGCIFNKGMLYKGFTDTLKEILDVQRSGQIPRYINDGSHYASTEMVVTTQVARDVLGNDFEGGVDWEVVQKTALGSYHHKISALAQKKQQEAKEALDNLVGKHIKATVEYWPGQKVVVTTREGVEAAQYAQIGKL
jgi:hypothetical protein